jgi:hypothetical protein
MEVACVLGSVVGTEHDPKPSARAIAEGVQVFGLWAVATPVTGKPHFTPVGEYTGAISIAFAGSRRREQPPARLIERRPASLVSGADEALINHQPTIASACHVGNRISIQASGPMLIYLGVA